MSTSRTRLFRCGAFVGAIAVAACHDQGITIVDDYGPPAGYAIVTGSVRQASGAAAGSTEVMFTRCGSPVGGFLVAATTDGTGQFRAEAHLPPRGALPIGIADTLQLACDVVVNRSQVALDSVRVRFATSADSAPVTTIRVVLP